MFRICTENAAASTWQGTITTRSAFKQFNSWDPSKGLVFPDYFSHSSTCNFFLMPPFTLAIYRLLCCFCALRLDVRKGEGMARIPLDFVRTVVPEAELLSSW